MLSFGTTRKSSADPRFNMTAQEVLAIARAEQDFNDGLSIDENPFPPGTSEHHRYHEEFDRLQVQEAVRDLSAA